MIQETINLEPVGNVNMAYNSQLYKVRCYSPLSIDGERPAILKPYSLVPFTEEHFPSKFMKGLGGIVQKEISSGDIDTHLGLGFLIISDGFLSIHLWGGEYPSILNTSLYSFTNLPTTEHDLKKEDIRTDGIACAYEGEIIGFESNKWLKFLRTSRSNEDKLKYLSLSERKNGVI